MSSQIWSEAQHGGGVWCIVDQIPLVSVRAQALEKLVKAVPQLKVEEIARTFLPLLFWVEDYVQSIPASQRILIGVVGPVGKKSQVAKYLAECINVYSGNPDMAVHIDAFGIQSPQFTVQEVLRDTKELRDNMSDLVIPTKNGKPVDNAVHIKSTNRVVVVEAAYLWHNLGEWVEIRRMLTGLLYVDEGESFRSSEAMVEEDAVYLHFDNKDLLVPNPSVLNPPTPSILAVGPNPAFQKSLSFKKLVINDVNRADSMNTSCGGKVARGRCAVAQFLGERGEAGKFIKAALDEWDVPQITGWYDGTTRTCTTCLDQSTGQMTELIEPSDTVPPETVDALLDQIKAKLHTYKAVALCGTYPPGVSESFYASIASSLAPHTLLLLDGYRGVDAVLHSGRVDVLKINKSELLQLTGETTVDKAASKCFAQGWISQRGVLAITDGPGTAYVFERSGKKVTYAIPALACVNPIGAGDTCSSIMLYRMVAGTPPTEAFAWGLAAASASCLHMQGAYFHGKDMCQLYDSIVQTEGTF